MQNLILDEIFFSLSRNVLKAYLDKGYCFKVSGASHQSIKKDCTYDYPYRFEVISSDFNTHMDGIWSYPRFIVSHVPHKPITFKTIFQCY